MAERRRLTAIGRQDLWRLETGKVKNPEPDVLRELAVLYDINYELLVALFVEARFGVKVFEVEPTIDDFVTHEEQDCLRRLRRLPPSDRELLMSTLARLGGAPSGAEFRDEDRDGKTNRRSGVDRRKEDPKSAA
jgi:hypothetical protein